MDNSFDVIRAMARELNLECCLTGGQVSESLAVIWSEEEPSVCDGQCKHALGDSCKRGVRHLGIFYTILMWIRIPEDGTIVFVDVSGFLKDNIVIELANPDNYLILSDHFKQISM